MSLTGCAILRGRQVSIACTIIGLRHQVYSVRRPKAGFSRPDALMRCFVLHSKTAPNMAGVVSFDTISQSSIFARIGAK